MKKAAKGEQLRIVYRATSRLSPDPTNARTHSRAQIADLAEAIKRFGFVNPILLDDKNRIIAGHGRVQAAEAAGLKEVPCIVLPGLSETQKTALALADNKLGENSGWDENLLRAALERVDDRAGLGFSQDDLKKLFAEPEELVVRRVETSQVQDRFWISIRGPLAEQARALRALREIMAGMTGVEVELGTIPEG